MKFIRLNMVEAEPMKFGEFKEKFPKSGGANVERDANDDGYVITYRKGEPNEYVSWCPKAEFDLVSRPIDNMTFGMAIEAMKQGKKVARAGWNGKGMFLWLKPATTIKAEWCKDGRGLLRPTEERSLGLVRFACTRTIRLNESCILTNPRAVRRFSLVGFRLSQICSTTIG